MWVPMQPYLALFKVIFIIIQIVFMIGVIPAFLRPFVSFTSEKERMEENHVDPKLTVAILLPFHREHPASMVRTVKSIIHQDYPRELINAYVVVDHEDEITKKNVPYIENILKASRIRVRTVITHGGSLGKPDSMNEALKHIKEDVVMVFDADDIVPPDYVSKAVSKIVEGATAVTTKVYRKGGRLHSNFLLLDTFIWYNIYMPIYMRVAGYAPMSGEGLTVRREYLERLGGFPRSITEDAYLTIELASHGRRMEYLNDTCIVEQAPLTFRALLKQRIRWFKGYYECLTELLRRKKFIGTLRTLVMVPAYMGPLMAMATTLSYTIFMSYIFGMVFHIHTILTLIKETINGPIYYVAASLFFGGNLFFISTVTYYSADTSIERYAPYIYLAFIYWYIIGLTAIVALLVRELRWYRTERIADV